MKKNRYFLNILTIVMVLFLFSCGKKEVKVDNNADKMARDSVEQQLTQLNSFLDVVSASMDSISSSQGFIFKGSGDNAVVSSKEQIKRNIVLFKNILNRQQTRINELEKSLGDKNDARSKKLRSIIESLNKQIEEKNVMIEDLKKQLNEKDVNIAALKTHAAEQDENISSLNQKNQQQEEAMTQQTNLMNEAYVKVATKKELTSEGLLVSNGGLFSKKRLDISKFNNSNFKKVDMRTFRTLKINGKNPRILTQIPLSSYKLQPNGDGTSTLTVVNATTFWSVSKYLVIRSD
jgi:chromosome segregation ATPase